MSEEYEIIFITEEGRAIINKKTRKVYHSEFEIIEEKNKEIDNLKNRLDNEVAENNLRLKEIEQLENIRKEAIEYIENNKETREHYEPYGTPMGNPNYTTTHIFGYYELLDILNKGSDKE